MLDLSELFEKYDDEYLEFERVQNKFSTRQDLHAFILLDKLVPGIMDIISDTEHDEFYVSVEPEELAKVASEQDIVDLIRCGMMFHEEYGFSFFV